MLNTVIWWIGALTSGGCALVLMGSLAGVAVSVIHEATYGWLKETRNWWTIIRWMRAKRDKDPLERLAREVTEADARAEKSHKRFELGYEEAKRQLGEDFDLAAWHRAVYPEEYEGAGC